MVGMIDLEICVPSCRHAELCGGVPGVCPEMHHIDGPHLIEYLKNVTFKGDENFPVLMILVARICGIQSFALRAGLLVTTVCPSTYQ